MTEKSTVAFYQPLLLLLTIPIILNEWHIALAEAVYSHCLHQSALNKSLSGVHLSLRLLKSIVLSDTTIILYHAKLFYE